MTPLTAEDKLDLAAYRMEKAGRLLDDAKRLFEAGSFESSVNRSYYAILSASRALLALRGMDPETHDGVKMMLSKEFIKAGLLPKEFGETFRSVQARRVDSDYGDYVEIGREEAADSLKRAQEFVARARQVMQGTTRGA
jgi:uncharacterized protein (UPF0332 family)